MSLDWLKDLVGGGGGGALGGLIGGLGSILGGNSQKDAADDMIDFARDTQYFVHDRGNRDREWKAKISRKTKARNDKIADRARGESIGAARDLRGQSRDTAEAARNRNLRTLTKAQDRSLGALASDRRAGIADVRGNRRENIGDINRTEAEGLGDIRQTERQNLRTARNQLGASLDYFNPAIQQGNNALSAFSQMLGLRGGGFDMGLTPATQYLLDQGRDSVEGGAAGAGGLYSGETMAELEKMRHGLVSQDYQTQMAQMMGLVGVGQNAGNSAAALRSGFADDAGAYRTDARNAGIGVRGAATDGRTDARDDATQAILGLRDNATQSANALRSAYGTQVTGVNDRFADRQDNANVNYANAFTNASDTWATRRTANNDNLANRLHQGFDFSLGSYTGAMGTLAPIVGAGYANRGNAGAAQWAGLTRGVGNALGDYANWQGQQAGGGTPLAPLPQNWTSGLY